MTQDRFEWNANDLQKIRDDLTELDRNSLSDRAERYQFIQRQFGPPTSMLLLGGSQALMALNEMQGSYIWGNFLSVILNAHIFVEQSLAGPLIISGEDHAAEGGLAAILAKCIEHGSLDDKIAARIDELRRMRIAYFHAHSGLKERSYMGRLISKDFPTEFEMIQEDARDAITIVVDLLRYENPDHRPGVFGDELGN
ncbi:MAG: hypothetical protein ACE37E_17610 [Hyphomicrobiales bacterium]